MASGHWMIVPLCVVARPRSTFNLGANPTGAGEHLLEELPILRPQVKQFVP